MVYIVHFSKDDETWAEMCLSDKTAFNRVQTVLVGEVYWEIDCAPESALYFDVKGNPCFQHGTSKCIARSY